MRSDRAASRQSFSKPEPHVPAAPDSPTA
eukprot:COSAG02_NODE_53504_length_301_cov_1.014851_1_plen_28_part_01